MIRTLIALVLVLLSGYGVLKAWPLIVGPALSITVPEDYASFPGGTVAISGNASRIAMLSLDGATLLRNENGDFTSTLTFPAGGSVLTFVATDQFGRHITVTRSIFVP